LCTSVPALDHGLSGAQVTGASDKTLRQWDMATGQCIMTMDILWALSHPPPSAGVFAAEPTPAYANGSYDVQDSFVGGVQFWGYALVSGSGDGAVRMWDSASLPPPRPSPHADAGGRQCARARRTARCRGTRRR
jgi:WD40 repeat protein